MPIKVKRDIKKRYEFGNTFSLKDIPSFSTGSVLNRVRADIALQNWDDFYKSWDIINVERDLSKSIAFNFNLLPSEEQTFNDLWTIAADAHSYAKSEAGNIEKDILDAYKYAAKLASDQTVDKNTFKRVTTKSNGSIVIFSDFHMTDFNNKPNYFKDYNYDLYLDVLKYYAANSFCLVENGDVEECLIYAPTAADASLRKKQAPDGKGKFPITLADDNWDAFLATRYKQRLANLNGIIAEFQEYYEYIKNEFINKGRYVRIAGNHDTYLDQNRERDLKNRIEDELGITVYDALRVERDQEIRYLVMHGHQFDPACLQHGNIPYAKSLGEVYSECLGWAFQGPDRSWTTQDTKKWYIGNSYRNILAREIPGVYQGGGDGGWDLLTASVNRIKEDSKDFVETLLGHEIAWDYFENTDGFNALTLEVFTGEELYKMRHMNERELCTRYASEYLNIQGPSNLDKPIPALVLGHTHEPRKNALNELNGSFPYYYINTGSAGRYENLIWCLEILENEDSIVSWSSLDGKLKKINWRSEGSLLVHDTIEWIII